MESDSLVIFEDPNIEFKHIYLGIVSTSVNPANNLSGEMGMQGFTEAEGLALKLSSLVHDGDLRCSLILMMYVSQSLSSFQFLVSCPV